jgi:oligopeptide transport system substrate-binding protein
MRRRRFLQAAGCAALVAGAAGSGRVLGQAGAPAATGRLRRAVASEVTSLDPQRPTGSLTTEMAAELFTGLTAWDAAGRLGRGCAESWSASADGLTWTFRLRPGLAWSDGAPLTSRDFLFTLRRYLAPETGAAQASRLDAIVGARDLRFGRGDPAKLGVTAPDPRTLVIRLEHPDVELPVMLGAAYCVPGHVIAAKGREWAKPGNLVTNGPYLVQEWAAGAKVIGLRRNPRFHEAAAVRIERVDWLTGYDDATRLRLFRLGEADIASIEDAASLGIARRDLGSALRSSPECAVGWIGLNLARPALADSRVRRAMSLALDRGIIAAKVRGLGEQPSDSILPPGIAEYPRPLQPDYAAWPMAQRTRTARELMAAAGYGPGRRLRLGIGFPASPTGRKVYLAVSAMWKTIGVDAELQPLEGRAYNAALQKGQYDVFSYNSFAAVPVASIFLDRFLSDSAINFCAYRSTEFDRAFQAAERQLTIEARARLYAEADRVLLRDQPVIPLYRGVSNRLVSPRVGGWVDHPGHAHPTRFLTLSA